MHESALLSTDAVVESVDIRLKRSRSISWFVLAASSASSWAAAKAAIISVSASAMHQMKFCSAFGRLLKAGFDETRASVICPKSVTVRVDDEV